MFPPACFTGGGRDTTFLSDWSSAVCSSDLDADALSFPVLSFGVPVIEAVFVNVNVPRSEERRVGKESRSVGDAFHDAKVRRLQVTVAVRVHGPCDGVAYTTDTTARNVSGSV